MKRSLTKMMELIKMILVGQTEAGSVEVQPARDSQLKATNCRWGGSYLPSHLRRSADNSELCYAFENLLPKASLRTNRERRLSNSR
jgi:hypothetical protein